MSDLHAAIRTCLRHGDVWTEADAILALPEMQARERVIEAARGLRAARKGAEILAAHENLMGAVDALGQS